MGVTPRKALQEISTWLQTVMPITSSSNLKHPPGRSQLGTVVVGMPMPVEVALKSPSSIEDLASDPNLRATQSWVVVVCLRNLICRGEIDMAKIPQKFIMNHKF